MAFTERFAATAAAATPVFALAVAVEQNTLGRRFETEGRRGLRLRPEGFSRMPGID
ncbi:hypothetical protein ACFOW4_10655 [Micromonospora sp. GCM10011542]|uniref:hypothetical protein n=1 Tax=Micromonospora sp. GCM10011542 TaxID=3317337 RepID=UPI0036070C68